MNVELTDAVLDDLAKRVASILAAEQPQPPEPWLNTQQAAEYIAAPVSRIYDLVHRRAIPYVKEGSRSLLRRSDLDAWLASTERPARL